MSVINHQFKLATRPVGPVKRSDFNYTQEPVRDPAEGEVVVKILYISLDPAMRGWMNDKDRKSTRLNSSHIQKSRMPSSA